MTDLERQNVQLKGVSNNGISVFNFIFSNNLRSTQEVNNEIMKDYMITPEESQIKYIVLYTRERKYGQWLDCIQLFDT